MSKTTTVHPDGSKTVTTTEKPLGCCGWFLWICIGAIVAGGPAAYLPLWAAALCYIVEAVVGTALIVGWFTEKIGHRNVKPASPQTADQPQPPPSA